MAVYYSPNTILLKLLAAGIIGIGSLAIISQGVKAQEIGNYCLQDYRSGATCTANDVRIEEVKIVELIKPCGVDPNVGYMDVVFEALVSADGSPDRYDIGLFMALDGSSALSGDSCFHDYLAPPTTTTPFYGDHNNDTIPDIYESDWWNGESNRQDTCGDIESDTQVFWITQQVTVKCNDLDGNGAADVSVCTSWDNNDQSDCSSVQQAVPGTGSKCSCVTVNFDFTPNAVNVAAFSATAKGAPVTLYPISLGLILAAGLVLSRLARQRYLLTRD